MAGERLGPAVYPVSEMALRRAVDTLRRRNGMAAFRMLQGDGSSLARATAAVGLQGRLGDNATPDASPALDDLRSAMGAGRVRLLLIALAATG